MPTVPQRVDPPRGDTVGVWSGPEGTIFVDSGVSLGKVLRRNREVTEVQLPDGRYVHEPEYWFRRIE